MNHLPTTPLNVSTHRQARNHWRRCGLASLAAALSLGLSGCDKLNLGQAGDTVQAATQVGRFHAIDVTGAPYAQAFSLPDSTGQTRQLSDFKGKIVVVFFGFTQCPDVCPTSLAELAEVKRLLGKDGDKLQGIFVTVDPERDTPTVLSAYLQSFDNSFIALVPTLAQLPQLAKDFKIYYKKVDGQTPTSYTMDHTAGSYVYDTQGRLRLFTRYGSGAQKLAEDIQKLL